jgi:hypothetical protein
MKENRGQMSEDGDQRSEIRHRRSEDRGQMSGDAERDILTRISRIRDLSLELRRLNSKGTVISLRLLFLVVLPIVKTKMDQKAVSDLR